QDGIDVEALKRRLNLLQMTIDVYTDHLADAAERCAEWLPQQAGDDCFDVATVATAAAFAHFADYRLSQGREMMRIAGSSIAQAESDYGAAWVAVVATMPLLYEGDFSRASGQLKQALDKARATLGEDSGILGTAALLAAKCAVELGRDEKAASLLALGMRKFRIHGVLDTAVFGLDAALKLWHGDKHDAFSLLELRDAVEAYPPRLALLFACLLIRRLVRLGKLDAAQEEAARAGIPIEGPSARLVFRGIELNASTHDLIAAAQIDLDLARGHIRRAATRVAKQSKSAKAGGRSARMVELALDEAYINICSHKREVAARHLARAAGLAAKRGYIRPFRDRAELIAGLVNETRMKDWGFALDEERTFFARMCQDLPLTNSALLEQLDELNVAPTLTDLPTARELELLVLIETGLTNQQLADRLSLSVATVKWHLYNLYTKLGVSNRAGALSRARALNLLAR
ncbi:MAG: LuxR C-terminal-related transcriptional regulator, partial [Sinobacteraceae bacterium]|nr:LuxR C-terminal-related transcriptional regulator [Nevskiaceae bacterium]